MMPGMEQHEVLGASADYLCITQMLKATPQLEGADRFIYLEASNEALDQQNEVVLAKALADSADYFLKFGNLDLDHYTMIGAKQGIPNYNLFEIGRPVDVRVRDGKTFVKGQVYSGTGPAAEKANEFWSSLTEVNPPQRWYPSVGGAILGKSAEIDPKTGSRKVVVERVRWSNIGFSKTPVNANLPTVSTVPFGALAKSFTGAGWDLTKALEAGYGTDAASLTGGGAMRKQSLHGAPINYFDMRNRLAAALRNKAVGPNPGSRELCTYAVKQFGLSLDEAAECVERFMRDLKTGLKNRRAK